MILRVAINKYAGATDRNGDCPGFPRIVLIPTCCPGIIINSHPSCLIFTFKDISTCLINYMIIPCVTLLIKIKPHDENRRNPLDLTVTLLTKVGKCFIYMLPFSTLLLMADIIHHRTLFHWSYIQFQNPVWHIILNNCLWSKMTLSLEIILSSLCGIWCSNAVSSVKWCFVQAI